ncbi:MAG: hypothetical protein NWE98_10420 [Candidatus Bathyarchaeota archaeon]|nr:hypothetical protein [Candidatus Bathyarchaeota archaeon]
MSKRIIVVVLALLMVAVATKQYFSFATGTLSSSSQQLPSINQGGVSIYLPIEPSQTVQASDRATSGTMSPFDYITHSLSVSRTAIAILYTGIIGVAILLILSKKSSFVT